MRRGCRFAEKRVWANPKDPDTVELRTVDAHINDPAFADALLGAVRAVLPAITSGPESRASAAG